LYLGLRGLVCAIDAIGPLPGHLGNRFGERNPSGGGA
jgi:hypothetical protein